MAWLRLGVDTTRDAVDWVCCALAANGYDGDLEIVEADVASRWDLTLHLYLPPDPERTVNQPKLAEALAPLQRIGLVGDLALDSVPEKAAGAAPYPASRRVGERLVLLGHGDQRRPTGDEVVVRIGPGLAFGSGFHPATLASLGLLERHVAPGMDALDLGSGSGILSVAMARLGARVLALDNDPTAVAATREAVRRNGVEARVAVARGSLGRGGRLGHWLGWAALDEAPAVDEPARFDLIATNILARVHVELADDYRRALRPAGALIAAGFTVDLEEEVALALADVGFEPTGREQLGEYVALAANHRQPPRPPSRPVEG
jgi:ribosomal protein L11 methyltransferase